MQTEYKLLYRYVNSTTNTPITDVADYNKTEEFYNTEHQINVTKEYLDKLENNGYGLKYIFDGETSENYAATLRNEGDELREKLITENMANENKSNNLYVYNGTKKYFHTQFIPEQLGYVVRDWTKVPKEQIPSGQEDYTKHFVMLGGSQLGVDNAYLVCKPQYIQNYMKKTNTTTKKKCFLNISTEDSYNEGYSNNNSYFHTHSYISNLKDIINEEVMFKWYDGTDESIKQKYGESPVSAGFMESTDLNNKAHFVSNEAGNVILVTNRTYTGVSNLPQPKNYFYLFYSEGVTGIPDFNMTSYTEPGNQYPKPTYKGWLQTELQSHGYKNEYGTYICVDESNIIRDIIPAHYEETGKNPYIIKDTYKKVELSPWMLHSTHKSLENGLEMAKKLVSMIGIDNVKLIKYVPIDQKIMIR